MASGLVLTSIRPAVMRASTGDGRGSRRAPARAAGGGNGNWWAPLFGWRPEPDYMDGAGSIAAAEEKNEAGMEERRRMRQRSGPRCAAFTEEKARELRLRTMETEAFHDAMYHSAIASRLASDLPRRSPNL